MSSLNSQCRLKCFITSFAGTYSHDLCKIENKDLTVADFSCFRSVTDCCDHIVNRIVIDSDFDLRLGQKIHDVFGSTVKFCMSFLTSETFYLGHCHSLHAYCG